MVRRFGYLAAGGILALAVPLMAQERPGAGAAATAPAGMSAAVEKEMPGLTAADFPEREAAIRRLQALMGEQIKERAQIQEIIDALQGDLAKQERALAMVTDEEAAAQMVGLMEMERGLAGWTIQTMGESVARRKALLAWGLGTEVSPVLAQVYAVKREIRLDGVQKLGRIPDEGASWTLARLINDSNTAVRAAAMAAAWGRKANPDVVAALWYRAVSGPLGHSERNSRLERMIADTHDTIKVDFPEGEPLEFAEEDESGEFYDALLAGSVLVHLNSPLVGDRVKQLVEDRKREGKALSVSDDIEWGLVTHRLVETYGVKEAVPLLAAEGLGMEHDEMSGDMNGRPFVWSQRTMAIGVLLKLVGKDPADFQLMRVVNSEDGRGWMWATDMAGAGAGGGAGGGGPQRGRALGDGAVVRAFYDFWKAHHAEYGVKEEPSAAAVPAAGGRGRGGRPGRGGPEVEPNGAGMQGGVIPAVPGGDPGPGGAAGDEGGLAVPAGAAGPGGKMPLAPDGR